MVQHVNRISPKEAQILAHDIRWKIMELLSRDELIYAKRIAETLQLSEQKVHYHITQLRNAGLLVPNGVRSIKRGRAKLFKPVATQFLLSLSKYESHETAFDKIILNKFFQKGQFSGTIIVGSAEPHGKYDAISRDGHLVGELCWYLGNHSPLQKGDYIPQYITTDLDHKKFNNKKKTNLILIGGHITNTVTAHHNAVLKSKFDISFIENQIVSGQDEFSHPAHGLIALFQNPKSPDFWILILAGVRSLGTQAAIFSIISDRCDLLGKGTEFATVIQGESKDGLRIKGVKKVMSIFLDSD